MKRIIFIGLMALFISNPVHATPIYLEFSGSITSVQPNLPSGIDTHGLDVGTPVQYEVMIDKSVAGYEIDYWGGLETKPLNPSPNFYYFLADYISGPYIEEDPIPHEWHVGSENTTWGPLQFQQIKVSATGVYGGINIQRDRDIDPGMGDDNEYRIGDVHHLGLYAGFGQFYMAGTLQVTGVADTLEELRGGASVPEPSTMLLFVTGLVGLVGFGRKNINK